MGKKKNKNQSFDTQSEVSSLGGSINSKSTFKTNLSDCEDEPDFCKFWIYFYGFYNYHSR